MDFVFVCDRHCGTLQPKFFVFLFKCTGNVWLLVECITITRTSFPTNWVIRWFSFFVSRKWNNECCGSHRPHLRLISTQGRNLSFHIKLTITFVWHEPRKFRLPFGVVSSPLTNHVNLTRLPAPSSEQWVH